MIEALNSPEQRPSTPSVASQSHSEHTTPSKSANTNGKRPMECSNDGPSTRRGDHLQNVQGALERWRFQTKRDRYSPSSVTTVTLLPDPILTTLASNAHICTIEDIETKVNPRWIMAQRHGSEVLEILKRYDDAERTERERAKREKASKRRKETEARQAAQKAQKDHEREERRRQKEQERADKERQKAEERAEKRRQRDAARVDKQQQRDEAKNAKGAGRVARPPLVGSGMFNVGPSTPSLSQVCPCSYIFVLSSQLISQIPNHFYTSPTLSTITTPSPMPRHSTTVPIPLVAPFSTPSHSFVWTPLYSPESPMSVAPQHLLTTPDPQSLAHPRSRPRPRPYIRLCSVSVDSGSQLVSPEDGGI